MEPHVDMACALASLVVRTASCALVASVGEEQWVTAGNWDGARGAPALHNKANQRY